jgi:hypothetical protein
MMKVYNCVWAACIIYFLNLSAADTEVGNSIFKLKVHNASACSLTVISHNVEPLANVAGQELTIDHFSANEEKVVVLDAPYVLVKCKEQSKTSTPYAFIELSHDIIKMVKVGVPIKISFQLKNVEEKKCLLLFIDNLEKADKDQTVEVSSVELEQVRFFDLVQEALLEKCGIKRPIKNSPAFYRRYLRASC